MRTNIDIDDQLMKQTMKITGQKTKKGAVEEAMRRLVRIQGQAAIRQLRGKVQWIGDLDEMRRD
jgi:Arc/MetJ family transcription regulator